MMLPLKLDAVSYGVAGRMIINALSCEISDGLRTVILGPNGAGKSVLMRLCHGLLQPTAGRVQWQGSGRQAMVFQRPVMLRRSSLANVIYGLRLAGFSRQESAARAADALEAVGLLPLAQRAARVLSGGEQQRLALARAWAQRPDVLFMDEPTANLDPRSTREIEQVISVMHASGIKIVMTTHNLGQARRLGDEILFLNEGRLAERASSEAFFRAPVSPEARTFLQIESP